MVKKACFYQSDSLKPYHVLMFCLYLSALRMGLLVERGLGETKEAPRPPFLKGASWLAELLKLLGSASCARGAATAVRTTDST